MGEIPKSHSTSQLVLLTLLNEKYLIKMKLFKSVVFVCLFLGMINLQSFGENYEKVAYKLVKFDKGKNDLDINGVNVRKFNNYINKKRQNKTYLLDYSTVTAFAKFLG